jgi:hypothetical protein
MANNFDGEIAEQGNWQAKQDDLMADKEWRPQNPYPEKIIDVAQHGRKYPNEKHGIFEDGASAMHNADAEYLDGACTEHPISVYNDSSLDGSTRLEYPAHKYLCPICYAKWKEEK